jgi:hypothetical protein
MKKSSTPVVALQLSAPCRERAKAMNSAIVPKFSEEGTEIAIATSAADEIGLKSRAASYGSLSWVNGLAVTGPPLV